MPTVYVTAPCDSADVVHDDEAILLAKTTDDAYDDLRACVEDIHPYDLPCIERFDAEDVLPAYGEWIATSVEPSPSA